jgi:hypothetical protein
LPCPASNCLTVNSSGATASNGVITVSVTCNLSTTCQGAFLLCLPNAFCQAGSTEGSAGGRLAGSDFTVSGGSTSDITVALTALGEQVTSGISGFDAAVFVDLLDYGAVSDSTSANFRLASDDPPTFPDGATANCGGAVFAGPDVSCPFALNVQQAYTNTTNDDTRVNNATVTAVSPVTGEQYSMQCMGQSPVVCTGGNNALVAFYA